MRQAGILAAAGLIALEDGPQRLHQDHENAKSLARGLAETEGININVEKVATNIVIFDISATGKITSEIVAELSDNGILAIGFGNLIRMVTHLDISSEDVSETVSKLEGIIGC
jgi:threonine aldolase